MAATRYTAGYAHLSRLLPPLVASSRVSIGRAILGVDHRIQWRSGPGKSLSGEWTITDKKHGFTNPGMSIDRQQTNIHVKRMKLVRARSPVSDM
jgi:hypothetical protein